jgi:hypothetical protein
VRRRHKKIGKAAEAGAHVSCEKDHQRVYHYHIPQCNLYKVITLSITCRLVGTDSLRVAFMGGVIGGLGTHSTCTKVHISTFSLATNQALLRVRHAAVMPADQNLGQASQRGI